MVSNIPENITLYEMIEKRVMWGILIGLGIFAIFSHQILNWKSGIFACLSAVTLGIVIARIIGMLMDGFFTKQLMWLGVELLFFGVFAVLYWRLK